MLQLILLMEHRMHYAYVFVSKIVAMVVASWMLLNADLQVYVPGFNDPEAPFFKTPDPRIQGSPVV